MYDVVVYLSSLPRIADHNRKVEVLQAFAHGARACGANVLLQTQPKVVDCRLAVILGWVGTKISGAHIKLRQDVIGHQRSTKNHVMPIDGSCFKFADKDNVFLRYSLDGVFYNKNNYANTNSDATKWLQISSTLGIAAEPWRTTGDHVLICLQRDGGWSMKGIDMLQWTMDTVQAVRSHTQRPIVIRPHPKHKINLSKMISQPKISQSTEGSSLSQDLTGAWAAVFCNSSSSVAAALAGIPVFAYDDDCVSWKIANHDIQRIEDPVMPDRTQWLNDLSAAHWTDTESQQGKIYQRFLDFI